MLHFRMRLSFYISLSLIYYPLEVVDEDLLSGDVDGLVVPVAVDKVEEVSQPAL